MISGRDIDKYFRKVSGVNIPTTIAYKVDNIEIEKLNHKVSKKLEQNKQENIASILDAEDVVVGGKVLKK